MGVISALVAKDDRIISDRLNHASIVDGCRLSGARIDIFPHRDVAALRRLLAGARVAGRTLVVTDGVFSMDGDVAPIPEILSLCRDYGALLMVDDAHGTGVLGKNGRGSLEHLGVHDDSLVQIGTFSKALGSLGGFAAASRPIIDFLKNSVRTLFYSTGLPSPVAASNREALRMVDEEPGARWRISAYAKRIRDALNQLGFPKFIPGPPLSPLLSETPKRARVFRNPCLMRAFWPRPSAPPRCRKGPAESV